MDVCLCPRHTVPKWLRDGYTKSKMQNSVLYRTMPYYHRVPSYYLLVSYLHLRASPGSFWGSVYAFRGEKIFFGMPKNLSK